MEQGSLTLQKKEAGHDKLFQGQDAVILDRSASSSSRDNKDGNVRGNLEVFGLYELSVDGRILYSRPRGLNGLDKPTSEIVGQDFFHDIVGCDNKDDLRRHFRQFIVGGRPVDAFFFDCMFEREIVRTKIFMTRAFETDDEQANGIVIMDIRQAGQ